MGSISISLNIGSGILSKNAPIPAAGSNMSPLLNPRRDNVVHINLTINDGV
jgi:hypothetical protein